MKPLPAIQADDLQLRASVTDDEATLFTLFCACRDDLLAAISNLDGARQESLLRLQYQAQREQYHGHFPHACQSMVLYAGEVIGQILVERRDQEISLVDLGLLPKYRNRGVGGVLVTQLLREAEETGRRVVLHVLQGNPAARLYRRLGFETRGGDGVYQRMEWMPSSGAGGVDR